MLSSNKREWKGDINDIVGQITIICGHFPFGLHKMINVPCRYITILRDPVERIISHYYYVKRKQNHHHNIKAQQGMEELLDIPNDPELNNLQLKMLTNKIYDEVSEQDVDIALDNLATWFDVVGVQERYAEFLQKITKIYGWNCPNHKLNATKNKPPIKTTIRNKIEEMNRLDRILYDRVNKLY